MSDTIETTLVFLGLVAFLFIPAAFGASYAYHTIEQQCAEKSRAVLTQTTSINCEVKKWTP